MSGIFDLLSQTSGGAGRVTVHTLARQEVPLWLHLSVALFDTYIVI